MFADPEHYPWTIAFIPSYVTEARIYARHILATKPGASIAILYQNDDFGKGYLSGLRSVLGSQATLPNGKRGGDGGVEHRPHEPPHVVIAPRLPFPTEAKRRPERLRFRDWP
jgi:hypothetical protein